jgi:hypothetical protein
MQPFDFLGLRRNRGVGCDNLAQVFWAIWAESIASLPST